MSEGGREGGKEGGREGGREGGGEGGREVGREGERVPFCGSQGVVKGVVGILRGTTRDCWL